MSRPDLPARVRLALTVTAGIAAAPTSDCPNEDVIAALAEGSIAPEEREAVLPHLAACAWCRRSVAAVARALADREVTAAVAAVERAHAGRWQRMGRLLVPLAAAGLLVLLAWPPAGPDPTPHRAPTITASPSPVPLAPVGTVADPRQLVWSAVPGADLYRVTVFAREGIVLYETQLADTTTVIPDSVVIEPARRYLWKVDARTDLGRWTTSDLVEFATPGGVR